MSNYESKKSFEGVPPFATATEEEIQVSERFERGNWFTPIEPKPIYDGYAPARPFPKLVTEFGQPAPIQNDKPALWPMVIEDFKNLYPNEPEVYASIEIPDRLARAVVRLQICSNK